MSLENFEKILQTISPHTKFIALHLMGEPLAHPHIIEILEICEKNFISNNGPKVIITTNGILIKKYQKDLLNFKSIHQINFSLHSYTDNFKDRDFRPYLLEILNFSSESQSFRDDLYVNFRLWSLKNTKDQNLENEKFMNEINHFFQVEISKTIDVSSIKSKKIKDKIYYHFDSRFEWPSLEIPIISKIGTCHGLTQHIGIHADGTVVPCCLDKEAKIPLGNILKTPLTEILNQKVPTDMKIGFKEKKLIHPLCQRCQFITRFQ